MDIFCLQEVVQADVQRRIYSALRQKYPYAVSALDLSAEVDSSQPACTLEEAGGVQVCTVTNCAGLDEDSTRACVIFR